MNRPRIALSMGDPAGIGPELICRLHAEKDLLTEAELTVFGSQLIFERVAKKLNLPVPPNSVECCAEIEDKLDALKPGTLSEVGGDAAIRSLTAACDSCLMGHHQALVTAPINKEAAQRAGFQHPGHTEFLAQHCSVDPLNSTQVAMAMHGPTLTVALVTTHCSIKQAAELLSQGEIIRIGTLLDNALSKRLGRKPRLACLGLNPHAGEGGLFGLEDLEIIKPAVGQLVAQGIQCDGPLASDTAFTPLVRQHYDGFICCYHDQGLIPFKMLHFEDGVNWTLGLPIIRTSPDHGTAFDIAWQGKASPHSLRAAIRLAVELS